MRRYFYNASVKNGYKVVPGFETIRYTNGLFMTENNALADAVKMISEFVEITEEAYKAISYGLPFNAAAHVKKEPAPTEKAPSKQEPEPKPKQKKE